MNAAGSGVTLHNWSAMNKMFLYSTSGNLGIGERFSASDVPSEKLDVDGNANFRGQLIMDNTEGDNEVVFPDGESLSLTFQVREQGRAHGGQRVSVGHLGASSLSAGQPDWGHSRWEGVPECAGFSPQCAPTHLPSNSSGALWDRLHPTRRTAGARRTRTARATRRG
jgi:hypothetical protein